MCPSLASVVLAVAAAVLLPVPKYWPFLMGWTSSQSGGRTVDDTIRTLFSFAGFGPKFKDL